MKKSLLILLVSLSVALASPQVRYDGFKVYRVSVADEAGRADAISSLADRLSLDVWRHSSVNLDVMAGPTAQRELERALDQNGLDYRIMVENVQSLIDGTAGETAKKSTEGYSGRAHNMDWVSYHSLEEIYEYIDYIAGNTDA